jgi:FtsH-binding integral membrane protein
MNTLYWINVLGNLSTIAIVTLIIGIVFLVLSIVAYIFEDFSDDREKHLKLIKIASISVLISALLSVFIPDRKELYIIYGIGGTIDYIKNNDSAKQIPDKCIDVINKYLDEINKED